MECSWSFFFRTWKKEEWINTERNNIQVLKIFKRKRFVDLSRNLSSFRKNAKKNKKYKMKKKKKGRRVTSKSSQCIKVKLVKYPEDIPPLRNAEQQSDVEFRGTIL